MSIVIHGNEARILVYITIIASFLYSNLVYLLLMVEEIPSKWDETFDVIIIGAGNSGLPAAYAAAKGGANVAVLEQMPCPSGSLTRMAGWINQAGTELQKKRGIEDSPDIMFKDFVEVCQPCNPINLEVVKNYCRKTPEIYPFLEQYGAKCLGIQLTAGASRPRGHVYSGVEALKALHRAAQEAGAKILFKHKVLDLYRDPTTKRIVGVKVRVRRGEYANFKARKAVILASGATLDNPLLVWEFGSYRHASLCCPEARGHTGEMILALMRLGIPIRYPGTHMYASIPLDYNTRHPLSHFLSIWWAGAVLVNINGVRFVNEDEKLFPTVGEACFLQPDAISFVVFDQSIYDLITREVPQVIWEVFKLYKANTLEELAGQMGVPTENLVNEIEKYNEDLKKYGYDRKFGRRKCLLLDRPAIPIEKPPFYAIKGISGLTSTRGGVMINAKGQVLDVDYRPVPGLYAVGELATGGLFRDGNYICGTHTSFAISYGLIVGENVARGE